MGFPCIGRMNGGVRNFEACLLPVPGRPRSWPPPLRRSPARRRRLPDGPGWARLPADEFRPLPRGRRDLRPPLLHAGTAAADLRRVRGRGERRELDGVGGDRWRWPVRPPDERALGTLRSSYGHDRVAGRGGDGRTAGPLRPVPGRTGRAARGAGRRAGGTAGVGHRLPGRGGPSQGTDHGDRPVRGRQQRGRDERPGHHGLGRAGVGLAGRGRRDRRRGCGLRGGLPAAASRAASLPYGLPATAGPGAHGPYAPVEPPASAPVRDRRPVHDGVRRGLHGDRLPPDANPVQPAQGIVGSIFLVYLVGTVSASTAGKLVARLGRRGALYLAGGTTTAGCCCPCRTPWRWFCWAWC